MKRISANEPKNVRVRWESLYPTSSLTPSHPEMRQHILAHQGRAEGWFLVVDFTAPGVTPDLTAPPEIRTLFWGPPKIIEKCLPSQSLPPQVKCKNRYGDKDFMSLSCPLDRLIGSVTFLWPFLSVCRSFDWLFGHVSLSEFATRARNYTLMLLLEQLVENIYIYNTMNIFLLLAINNS